MIIEGYVVQGKHLGRTIGFPTANIQAARQSGTGPDGVYASILEVDGKRLFSMVNIGRHPTLPEGGKTIEAHIFDYSGDLYGRQVRLETIAYIRGEQKFASVEDLRMQLQQDKKTALQLLSSNIPASPGIE